METWRKEKLADVINLVLGAGLFLSPWIFGFAAETQPSWNAWLSGIVIAALAIGALAAYADWEEWLNLIVGLWVAVSPWLVGFHANMTAAWVHLIAGAVVALVAAARIWIAHHDHPRVTA
jgi:SPW repeat